MRTWNKIFWLCLAGTILLAGGIIFLPRYLSRGLDMGMLNRVELAERENFSFLEQSSNGILENARAFRYLNNAGDDLMLIASYDESAKVNTELLEAVYDQAMTASELGMLPWISPYGHEFMAYMGMKQPYAYWADMVRFARYYSLTYDSESGSNTKEMLNFWYLRFSDGETFDYYFLVNAVTYQIYYAEIYNPCTDAIVNVSERMGLIYESADADIYPDDASVYKAQKTTIAMAYDTELLNLFWSFNDLFVQGSMFYYESVDYKYVSSQNLNNKLALIVLNYDAGTVYIEQLAMPENTFPYRGISVGLQNLGDNVQKLLTQ